MNSNFFFIMITSFIFCCHIHAQTPEFVLDNVSYMAKNNGKFFLHAGDYDSGEQGLWITDGTTQGSQLLKALSINPSASYTEFSGKTYFTAKQDSGDYALWVTDGTTLGTQVVKTVEIRSNMVTFNNHLFFTGFDPIHGQELWMSDGTESGTNVFKDIRQGTEDGLYYGTIIVYQNKLYFKATDGADNYELWISDGTTTGTVLFKDINPAGSSNPSTFNIVEDKLYFNAISNGYQRDLWVSDGTVGGTLLIKDIPESENSYGTSFGVAYNGKAYFTILKNTPPHQLWATDGTYSGTILIEENVGATVTVFNGELYFSKQSGANYALYKSDGTPGSGSLIKLLEGGNSNDDPYQFTKVNEKLYFFCVYDESGANYIAADLWETDGTTVNTKLIEDSSGNLVNAYKKAPLTVYNNELFFVNLNRDLYKISNPTASVSEVNPEDNMLLFPNPANRQLTIKINESLIGSQFEIINIMGQTLKSGRLNHMFSSIGVEGLPSGTYFVHVQSESAESTSSFIKK